MLNAAIVINPTSGKGRSLKNAPLAVARLRERGVQVRVLEAGSAEESLRLAREAVADGVEALIACGGDGTVHLALQAVQGTDTTLGIIPVGTGDDIARSLDLPRDDACKAADVIADGRTRTVDYAVIHAADGTERAFLAVMSVGFDSEVTERANTMTWPTGTSRYLLATIAELGVYKPVDFRITVDDKTLTEQGMMLAVGNGASYGGGMYVCPSAVLDDGQLDLTFLARTSKFTFLKTFPSVFKGTHVTRPFVHTLRGATVRVEAAGQTAYADGERVGPLPVDVHVVPGGLRAFAPVG
ncbi:MAG: diacylglycerol kinase [Actinobacteria bacterium]|nr:diacylglycerol kinase [Actinomycetota bacterium]MCB8996059.1 diacylglycerol kinase [Actinomycetota bacterium]MCB9424456.1 diacylglycerol kinase [Actinomycetota bacterium]HRY08392.1 diacylglycerol kinase [Candidatus Nanopelagicales bacterium]